MPLTESRLRVNLGPSADDLHRDITMTDTGHALDSLYHANKEIIPENAANSFDCITFSPLLV